MRRQSKIDRGKKSNNKIILTFIYLQELFKFQGQYGLGLIAETDVDIEVENFDPNKSRVTLRLAAAKAEVTEWLACENDNPDWKEEEKHFIKVTLLL